MIKDSNKLGGKYSEQPWCEFNELVKKTDYWTGLTEFIGWLEPKRRSMN